MHATPLEWRDVNQVLLQRDKIPGNGIDQAVRWPLPTVAPLGLWETDSFFQGGYDFRGTNISGPPLWVYFYAQQETARASVQ